MAATGKEMNAVDYTVHLDAQVGVLSREEEVGDRLLTALEQLEGQRQLAAPVTSQNSETGVLGATFCLTALDASDAAVRGSLLFQRALSGIGVTTPVHIASLQVEEEHEEAAALG